MYQLPLTYGDDESPHDVAPISGMTGVGPTVSRLFSDVHDTQ